MKKAKGRITIQNLKFYLVVLPFAFYLLTSTRLFSAAVWACPGCKEALFDPGQLSQKLSTARGYALSIGLLLAVPVGLVGGIAALIILAQRRQHRHITQRMSMIREVVSCSKHVKWQFDSCGGEFLPRAHGH